MLATAASSLCHIQHNAVNETHKGDVKCLCRFIDFLFTAHIRKTLSCDKIGFVDDAFYWHCFTKYLQFTDIN